MISACFKVPCGSYAKLTAYDLCPGICAKVYEVHKNQCQCEYFQKPLCLWGTHVGLDHKCSSGVIPMPGEYVIELCVDDGVDHTEFTLFADVCDSIENIQTVLMAANGDR